MKMAIVLTFYVLRSTFYVRSRYSIFDIRMCSRRSRNPVPICILQFNFANKPTAPTAPTHSPPTAPQRCATDVPTQHLDLESGTNTALKEPSLVVAFFLAERAPRSLSNPYPTLSTEAIACQLAEQFRTPGPPGKHRPAVAHCSFQGIESAKERRFSRTPVRQTA